MNRALAIIGGIGAGVAAAYFLDPKKGADRRALVRDKALNLKDDAMKVISEKTNYLREEAAELSSEANGYIGDGHTAINDKPAAAA